MKERIKLPIGAVTTEATEDERENINLGPIHILTVSGGHIEEDSI